MVVCTTRASQSAFSRHLLAEASEALLNYQPHPLQRLESKRCRSTTLTTHHTSRPRTAEAPCCCKGKIVLMAAHDGLGMQPGRAEAPPINPKKLVSSSARTLCKIVPFSPSLPSRIVTVAVKPDTSGTPDGTLSIVMRTGTRCAKRTQV